ncbi:MAG: 4-hydroxyphenylpyruvate dioxygenase [Candidatus Thermoplasmatota archaeon]|nr:4-hydroxyphenylpyruvate dioxygenase [Candidatus Thermoplasmatota archaeon]
MEQLPVQEFAYVELYVGNAKQAAYVYEHAYGFTPVAYAGPETGQRDRASYVMQQGDIRIVLTAPMTPTGPIAEHVAKHTDGVRDVAMVTDDVTGTYETAIERGAEAVEKPQVLEDENGTVEMATIATFGDTVHTFFDDSNYDGVFRPGYEALPGAEEVNEGVGLLRIDHTVGNVEDGEMETWASFYEDVFGFQRFLDFDEDDISTEYSALRSVVMANESLGIKIPVNEPAEGKKKSQIQEYLDFYPGPGIQHLAITTDDIVHTIAEMRDRHVDFLEAPDAYYEMLEDRIPADHIDEAIDALEELGILVDEDESGYLLQLFTNPIQDRPTVFFEIIQRKGAEGFGKGNFKALFESIEKEQEKRGNL